MVRVTEDTYFARYVVDHKLASEEEVQKCLARKQDLASRGKRVSLANVMVEQGVLTATQLKRLESAEDSTTRPAQQIPGFQILERIGAGAMATVYKAKQISLDRTVAVKVLPTRLSENSEFVERFYKEGKAAARLNHNNIVQAIDVGEADGRHYFVMEYVDGHTLYDELAKGKVFSEAEAIDIVMQIARALDHAQERGFIHRDVKPKNIMITKNRVAKLADMGLAREVTDMEAAKAEAGRAFGTPYYISPEQVRGEMNIDFRADVYSLGATFYHIVTGRYPFDGTTPSAVMHKHLKQPLIPPDHINTKLSSGIGEIIEVMMAKKADDRYASTKDLLADLEAVARGEPPLQARRRYDADILRGLAEQEESAEPHVLADAEGAAAFGFQPNWTIVGVLAFLLVLSLLLNLILLLR
ncbi:MAG: serine/threonine protein kinase [Phycisphaerae bacterium]|nr:serine/threonine protein kinase [Phycisphaerae bacterium]